MRKIFFTLFILGLTIISFSQSATISGRVYSESGEAVVGATIKVNGEQILAQTDNYGYFSLNCPVGEVVLKVSHISFQSRKLRLKIYKDTVVFIYLVPRDYTIAQVEVVANKGIVSDNNASVYNIPVKDFNKLPVVIGEKDLFKGLQTLPGIQPGAEGTSLLNIRGGSPDQNLILVDDMPIYYVSHLYGFLSTFNNEAIKSVKVYKGGFPVQYTEMTSSVVDIVMKDGDMRQRHLSAQISPMAASASFDGYLIKDKISMTMFYRRALIDGLLGLGRLSGMDIPDDYKFYDFNAKLRYKINSRNTLYFSFFKGRDIYKSRYYSQQEDTSGNILSTTKEELNLGFGNLAGSVRFFSILSGRLSLLDVAYFSLFDYENERLNQKNYQQTDSILEYYNLKFGSGIKRGSNRLLLSYMINNAWSLRFGINSSLQKYIAQKQSKYLDYLVSLSYKRVYFDTLMSVFIASPFFAVNYSGKKVKLYAGLTSNNYLNRDYTFTYVAPRVILTVPISSRLSLQTSYSQLHQYNHVLRSSAINMPSDLYLGSGNNTPPVVAKIYDASLSYKFRKWNFNFSAYYKSMQNLVRYLPGVDLLTMEGDWTDFVDKGQGYSYGLEILIEKKIGKFTGWLSYTYSRSFRQFFYTNSGKRFRYRYDRPHILSAVANYRFSRSVDLSMLLTLYSGSLISLPSHEAQIIFPNFPIDVFFVDYYSEINNVRLPVYHRLDIAFNYHKPNSRAYWSLGVYNLYNRLNPSMLEPIEPGYLHGTSFFPIMPFVSFRYQFDW